MKVYFHSGCTFSGPCCEDTLKLWYLFLTWLLVSTTVAKCAISQKYCDKQGHSCGSFTQKQGNSSHYWWEVSGGQGRASASWECSVCSETGAHSFPASKPCSGLPVACTAELCWQGFSQNKSWIVALKGSNSWQLWKLYPSGEKKKGDFLSRGYSHTLNSCWQDRRNLRRERSQKCFFSCPSAPSKQTALTGVAAACCFFHVVGEDLCQYIFGGEGLKQKEGFGLLRFL